MSDFRGEQTNSERRGNPQPVENKLCDRTQSSAFEAAIQSTPSLTIIDRSVILFAHTEHCGSGTVFTSRGIYIERPVLKYP